MAMVAHILYPAWDPERCASRSPWVIGDVIRGRIGFGGFLLSDDIGMGALAGSLAERARAVVEAGCDVALHCSGSMEEMEAVASAVPHITEEGRERLAGAMASVGGVRETESYEALAEKRDRLLALA
jgi:beta-N-acetylhexosaminidase